MPDPLFARRLLARGSFFGIREELIGEVLEEITRGRSRWWVCQQLIGLYGLAFLSQVHTRARLTPQAVALALCALLVAGASIGSASRVLELWLGFYYVAGTASLFAHMASHTAALKGPPYMRANVIWEAAERPR